MEFPAHRVRASPRDGVKGFISRDAIGRLALTALRAVPDAWEGHGMDFGGGAAWARL
jgi:hypothetical protein